MVQLLNQWLYCLKHYALMSVFASSPDRLSFRLECFILTLLCYCMLGFALVDEQHSYLLVLLQIALEVALLAVLAFLGLKWLDKLPRFLQCFSALVGVNFVISAVTIPIIHWITPDLNSDSAIDSKLLYATMIMVFWNLAAISQILKRTFEVNTVMSAMIAFNYFLIYQFTVVWFY